MYIDMHCDTLLELYEAKLRGIEKELAVNDLDNDLEKMKAGGCLLQNFAIAVNTYENPEEKDEEFWCRNNKSGQLLPPTPLETCLRVVDLFQQLMERYPKEIAPVYGYADIERNRQSGKISAMLTIEGGEVAMGSIGVLRVLHRLGVRMFGFTWNYRNRLAHPNLDLPFDGSVPDVDHVETEKGLTERGIEFLSVMEEIGMIPDVSHLSDAGFYDVARYAKKPFVASHSNTRAVCGQPRNLTDDMIRCLADHGGVAGINFGGLFVRRPMESGTADLVEHIKHYVKVGGIGCVGLGSDFDGIGRDKALENAAHMPELADALKKGGLTEGQIDRIFYQNVLRVYRDTLPA